MAQLNVLDLLRPDGRESGDRAGPRGSAQDRAAGLEQRTPGDASLRRGTISRSMIFRHGVFRRLGQRVAIFAHDGISLRAMQLNARVDEIRRSGSGVFLISVA